MVLRYYLLYSSLIPRLLDTVTILQKCLLYPHYCTANTHPLADSLYTEYTNVRCCTVLHPLYMSTRVPPNPIPSSPSHARQICPRLQVLGRTQSVHSREIADSGTTLSRRGHPEGLSRVLQRVHFSWWPVQWWREVERS